LVPATTAGAAVPVPTPAQWAALQGAAIAAAQTSAAANGATEIQRAGAPQIGVHPDTVEPINTLLGPFYADGCQMYAMFGNYAGVAFGKSEVWDYGASCGVADYILAYNSGLGYAYGNIASASAGTGWTNPQSQVSGYSVLSEYVTVCNGSNQCTNYEFDAL
jgi:hypothetical protein